MERIRVLLADDEEHVLDVMTDLLATDPAIDVVGRAQDARQAVELARAASPDVALVDVRMPAGGGAVAARGIRRGSPPTRVVAVSADVDPDTVVAMIDAGASGYVGKDEPVEQLLRAVHRAADGRASIAVREPGSMAELLVERGQLRSTAERKGSQERIVELIHGSGIDMVFQPIVDLGEGHVVGLEALARFRVPGQRYRPPDAWFADAASVGLLVELELAAIERAVEELDRIPEGTFLAVNVSPQAICSVDLPSALGNRPDRLVLEVTEGSPLSDPQAANACLGPLRRRGARLAIDDVGASHSGLARVVLLGPDLVKLDRSIVSGVAADRWRRSLIERLMAFADDMGIAVVAEGIESGEDLELLVGLGVPFGQGFHLGRPGPIPPTRTDELRWPGRHAFA